MPFGNTYTENDALSYENVDPNFEYSGRLSLFFKAVRGLCPVVFLKLLEDSARENVEETFLIVFNLRDVIYGKGERHLGRIAMKWLFEKFPEKFCRVMDLVPEFGRWDDLYSFFPNENSFGQCEYSQKAVKIFSHKLQSDYKLMKNGFPISLAAKWVETENSSDDKKFKRVKTHCGEMKLHEKGYRVRNGAMRSYINIVEKAMCNKEFEKIDYSKVPSQAMNKLKKAFLRNDKPRFEKYITDLQTGAAEVNTKTLQPHEILANYMGKNCLNYWNIQESPDELVEAQWKTLVHETKKLSVLDKTLVVSDTSGSMFGETGLPIKVSVALGLLISECCSCNSFKNQIITFDQCPQFFEFFEEDTLLTKIQKIAKAQWGCNTDLIKTFSIILKRAVEYKLAPEEMPERVIMISDMQFDQACSGNAFSNFEIIDQMFLQAGYTRPTLVFWNVAHRTLDFPAQRDFKNCALISGFSQNVLKTVISTQNFTPVNVMNEVIYGTRYIPIYQKLIN